MRLFDRNDNDFFGCIRGVSPKDPGAGVESPATVKEICCCLILIQ